MRLNIKVIEMLLFTIISSSCYSQKAWIEKIKCSTTIVDTIYKGYSINIFFKKDIDTIISNKYRDDTFINLSDKEKLIIIQQLLMLEYDTSLCCKPTSNLWGSNFECRSYSKDIVHYLPLQVDALYRINGIAFPNLCWIYSCYPNLYDKVDSVTINNKPQLIKEVYKEYKKWFNECKQKGRIGLYFPFNDGRYVWFEGKTSLYPKEE